MESIFLGTAIAFLVVLLTTPIVRKIAFKVGAVDKPDTRKVHSRLMPRLGGVAIYLGFVAGILVTQEITRGIMGLLIGSTLIVVLGIWDDIKDVSPRVKLLGQIVAALVLIPFGIEVSFITNPFGNFLPFGDALPLGYLSIPITVFWIVGVTNAVNLIDGLDGLAGGLAAIAAFSLAVISLLEGMFMTVAPAIILGIAILGFLKYNFHPAKIFMGDSGSMFLGYALASLSIISLTKGFAVISVFVPILIIGIPIFDTVFAIVRRFMNNQPIFKADKEHLHHCLLDMGFSHRQTVVLIYGINIVLAGSGILLTQLTSAQAFLLVVVITVATFIGADRIGVLGTGAAQSFKVPEQDKKYSA